MEYTSINGIGFKGLNSDLAPWGLDPEYITSGINFRLVANKVKSSGSFSDWSIATTTPSPDDAGHVFNVRTSTGTFWIVLCRTSVLAYDGSTWYDITSTALAGTSLSTDQELSWSSCILGNIPVVNNPNSGPEYWSPQSGGTILQPLHFSLSPTVTWASLGYSCDVIRSYKNFLFALSLYEGVTELPNAYRWSHPADINGLPFSWDTADASSLAGREQLGGDSGSIIDGQTLRDSFAIYSENGVNILDYTGDEFVFRRRELSSAFGVVGRDCIASIKGIQYFISDGDIIINDGNRIESAVHNKIRSRLTSQMSGDYYSRSFAINNVSKKEIWFCVPEDGAIYPNIAYVYNWKDDNWGIQDIPYDGTIGSEIGIVSGDYGQKSNAPITYLNVPGTYLTTNLTYGAQQGSPFNNTVVGAYNTSGMTELDPIDSTVGTNTAFEIERTDILIGDHDTVKTITRVYPYTDGGSSFVIKFGSQDYAGGSITWSSYFTFDPSTDRKIDLRSSGVLFAYNIKSIDEGSISLTGLGVDYALSGKR